MKWVHHDRVGYVFPKPAAINVSNREEQGRWSDITDQKRASRALVSMDVVTLWFDHGNGPRNASYDYIVVPDVEARELGRAGSGNRGIEIISNTRDIQAVKSSKLSMCQLAFYKAGEVDIGDGSAVRMASQGMAMLKMRGSRIEKLTVSDPSRKLGRITVTVPGLYDTGGDGFSASPDKTHNRTSIVVDLPRDAFAGRSVAVEPR